MTFAPLTLPWPYAGVIPEDGVCSSTRVGVARAYRARCLRLAREAGWSKQAGAPRAFVVELCPPVGWREADLDQQIARFAVGQAGLGDALGVHRANLKFDYALGGRCKAGRVRVTPTP